MKQFYDTKRFQNLHLQTILKKVHILLSRDSIFRTDIQVQDFSFFSLKKQHFSHLSTISYPHFLKIRILKKLRFCYTLILKAELFFNLDIFTKTVQHIKPEWR